MSKTHRTVSALSRRGEKTLAPFCALVALACACVSHPQTPEFDAAAAECRVRVATCPTAIGLEAWESCVRSTERACMAERGFTQRPGHGWIRVPRTDRDAGLELDERLPR